MYLKLIDDFIECDRVFGPMPDLNSSFEAYFIEKAYNLLYNSPHNHHHHHSNEIKYLSLANENDDLKWMWAVELARSSRHQNLEIIYNNNRVYFKTVRAIRKHEPLAAYPSKDLEISLGIQFIPMHPDDKYKCKKCGQEFHYQYAIMLHTRYFCSHSINNLLSKSMTTAVAANASNKRKQPSPPATTQTTSPSQHHHLEAMNPNELMSSIKRPRMTPAIQPTNMFPYETDYRTLIYQNYLRLFHQHQQQQQQQLQQQHQQQQPTLINQARLREQLTSQLLAYFEANHQNHQQQQQNIAIESNETSSRSSSSSCSSVSSVGSVFNGKKASVEFTPPQPPPPPQPPQPQPQAPLPPPPVVVKSSLADLNQLISTQAIQNWCAKCNTYFRLTSDLVHHMRTYHRKDAARQTTTTTSDTTDDDSSSLLLVRGAHDPQRLTNNNNNNNKSIGRDGAACVQVHHQLKCEICNEIFKEKHHLSRHMTSHR